MMEQNISAIVTIHQEDDISSVESCLKSIIHQTKPVKEIIIVDNSSSKEVCALAGMFSGAVGKIRYQNVPQEESGISLKVVGARVACCDWLAFIEPSEVWLTDKNECQSAIIEKTYCPNNTLILTDYYMGKINPDIPDIVNTYLCKRRYELAHDRNTLLLEFEPWFFSGMLIRGSFFGEAAERYSGNEWVFLLRLLDSANLVYLQHAFFIHKIIESTSRTLKMITSNYEALIQLKEDIIFNFGKSYWYESLRGCYNSAWNIENKEIKEQIFNSCSFDFGSKSIFATCNGLNHCFFNEEIKRLKTFCNSHNHVGCYGAGRFAERVLNYLQKTGVIVDCVIVSDGQKNASSLKGIKVFECSEIDLQQLDGIILAMDLRSFPGMKVELQAQFLGEIFTITYSLYSFLQSGGNDLMTE